jgi:hypothetical protein
VRHLLTHTTDYREFINTLIIEGRQVLEGTTSGRGHQGITIAGAAE